MLELVPGVSRNLWRDGDANAEAADAEYRAKRPAALARQNHTCKGCGVRSIDGMEIHHGDCNHANNADENLMAECVFCHPVNHIGELAARHARADRSEVAGGMARLTYLPELSQADLSHLLRTIGHVMNVGSDEQKADAQLLYEQLASYSHYVESAWGTAAPRHFAVALREVPESAFVGRSETMKGVRVIFSADVVKQLATRFAKEFVSLPLTAWNSIYQQRKARVAVSPTEG